MNVKKIAVFVSGSGTNAQNIITYFANHKLIKVDSVWSNNPKAYALDRARKLDVESHIFTRKELNETGEVSKKLKEKNIDLIVLAGFLWLIPEKIINEFPIINIHPALLPKYGGKGMYGMKVHQAVIDNADKETGITIHYVNSRYDEGKIIFQTRCQVSPEDTPEEIAQKVHKLEYQYFPLVIEKVLMNRSSGKHAEFP